MREKKRFRFGKKTKLIITAALLIALSGLSPLNDTSFIEASSAEPEIDVTIDGESVKFPSGYGVPFIDANDRTLVPLRGAMEAFGAFVSWDEGNYKANVEKSGTMVQVPIGQAYILVNGRQVANDTTAVILENRTYLPIRAVLEAFGADVSWDEDSRTVIVRTDGAEAESPSRGNPVSRDGELDAMWISYLEYMEMPKNEAGFKAAVDDMFDHCSDLGMNAVIVHVRSHSDAMYPSRYYPWSIFASGTQGVDPGYDPLDYMISAAHSRGLEFHAWLNPFRVTGYGCYWDQTAASSPAKIWLSDNDPSNDRWVLLHKGEYYLNPSVPQVRQMITAGIEEIVSEYDVDGIHLDDYFYPSLNDSDPSLCFDKPEHDILGSGVNIADWRRNNINMLIADVYSTVKGENDRIEFGISPAGNLDNLRKNNANFVDIDRWLSHPGYVDYIMPQLYWGFERKDSAGNIAAYAYENNLKAWIQLVSRGDAKLYIGLNMANAGSNVSDNNPVSEWLRYDDIIARQVETARATGDVEGYAFFRYSIFNKNEAQQEVTNLRNIL